MTGQTPVVSFRLEPEWQQDIDEWRRGESGHPSRSEAIRLLIGMGLYAAYEDRKRTAGWILPVGDGTVPLSASSLALLVLQDQLVPAPRMWAGAALTLWSDRLIVSAWPVFTSPYELLRSTMQAPPARRMSAQRLVALSNVSVPTRIW